MQANASILHWQSGFYAQWHAQCAPLKSPALRALAWLLLSPDLLNQHALSWRGKMANITQLTHTPDAILKILISWQDAATLEPLAPVGHMRLGRYAEKLLAYYFQAQGQLFAQGLAVRAPMPVGADAQTKAGNVTLGEFDFLLQQEGGLWHWELATKFYLFAPHISPRPSSDYFIGPNLADSLGKKMHKILERQLALGALANLPQTILQAKALIKGWLFYPFATPISDQARDAGVAEFVQLCAESGLSDQHCRGFWCTKAQLPQLMQVSQSAHWTHLTRLEWLAPAVYEENTNQVQSADDSQAWLELYFEQDSMPILLALLIFEQGQWRESGRVFVVPDDWAAKAHLMQL